jgi:hypothetical protein
MIPYFVFVAISSPTLWVLICTCFSTFYFFLCRSGSLDCSCWISVDSLQRILYFHFLVGIWRPFLILSETFCLIAYFEQWFIVELFMTLYNHSFAYELFDPVEALVHQDWTRFHAWQLVLHLRYLFQILQCILVRICLNTVVIERSFRSFSFYKEFCDDLFVWRFEVHICFNGTSLSSQL